MTTITFTYADGTTWMVAFNDLASANAWLANERQKPYWQATTQVSIVTAPVVPRTII